jgi:hypothetical protein
MSGSPRAGRRHHQRRPGGGGQVWFRGENIIRLSPRGRIVEVIGFQV